jgi:methylated-DNA-[protein]-cysteine S-methyltransferase
MTTAFAIATVMTPIGRVELHAEGPMLIAVRIMPAGMTTDVPAVSPLLREAVSQMQSWFAGHRLGFNLPLKPLSSSRGEALRGGIASIPYGSTRTYGSLADELGSAARAIGQACRTNAFPILIPCHRVVSSGATEFYSGGDGPRTKAWLIAFEQGKSIPYDKFDPNDQPRLL